MGTGKYQKIQNTSLVDVQPHLLQKYNLTPEDLQPIVRKREMENFRQNYGSIEKLVQRLQSNTLTGLSSSEIEERKQLFGVNKIDPPPPTPFWRLMLNALNDTTMIILIVSAVVSLVLTLVFPQDGEKFAWIDSVAILVAVVVVVLVTSCNDYSKEKQFRKLNAQKDDKIIKVQRDGRQQEISIHDIVVGDIVILAVGDQIPADGVLINGNDVKVDESGMTGESDEIKKSLEKDIFMIGSCLIRHGSGMMVVTAVGTHSIYGDILKTLQENDEETPLQAKLDELAKLIGYCGIASGALTFVTLVIRFLADGRYKVGKNFVEWVNYFILAITIIVVAVPEGLPLAVTISLAYSMKQMIKDQCLVRKLESCETMGSASNICTDKTGTLTLNQMHVTKARFGDNIYTAEGSNPIGVVLKQKVNEHNIKIFNTIQALCSTAELREEENKTNVIGNKTEGALLFLGKETGYDYTKARRALVVGDCLEGAIITRIDFSSDRKRMTAVLDMDSYRKNNPDCDIDGECLVLSKGASEIMLGKCSTYLAEDGTTKELTENIRKQIETNILDFAQESLRTLILAYKKIKSDDSLDPDDLESNLIMVCLVGIQDPLRPAVKQAIADCKRASITVRMVTGDNLITAIAISKDAGIIPSHLTTDQVIQQKMAITGPDFQQLSDAQVDAMLPTLVCMARSAPTDKYRLVCRLKANNYVVAATGDGSNDAPQLKAANVGLAMGIAGTEVAKEASDMIIMNDAFDTIVKAVAWGRTVTANVRKFLQFQLTVNVVALVIAFLGAAILEDSALTSIQLLYVNLIMDSFGSLALATERPSDDILTYPPIHRSASLITPGMLRNIFLISVYQMIIILIMMFPGVGDQVTFVPDNLAFNDTIYNKYCNVSQPNNNCEIWKNSIENTYEKLRQKYRYTCIYNFFIFAQIFNEFNSRRIGNELNVFKNIFKSWMFIVVIIGTTVFQIIIMLVPGIRDVFNVYTCTSKAIEKCFPGQYSDDQTFKAMSNEYANAIPFSIEGMTWMISIVLALLCFPLHFLGRLIKLKNEFPVSQRRIAKDMEKIRKRAEKQAREQDKKTAQIKAVAHAEQQI